MSAGKGGGGGIVGAYIVSPVVDLVKGIGLLTVIVLLVAGGSAAAYVCTNVVTAIATTAGIMVKQLPNAGESFKTGEGLVKAPAGATKSDDAKSDDKSGTTPKKN